MYKKQHATLILMVFAIQLATGTGFFCISRYTELRHSSSPSFPIAEFSKSALADRLATSAVEEADESSTVPCSCKKKQKCPHIPRVAITSPLKRHIESQLPDDSATLDFTFQFTHEPFASYAQSWYRPPLLTVPISIPVYTCALLI